MNRSTLTENYLARVHEGGAAASELIGRQHQIPLLNTIMNDFLPRPLFLGHDELKQLMSDLELFRTALLSLPARLFGNDLRAFARAAGLSEIQTQAILHSRGSSLTRLARVDMYVDESGFKLLEANRSSALGGANCAVMCRELLEHSLLADFAKRHNLGFVDTARELVDTMYAETGFRQEDRPVVAMADWPSSYESFWAPFLAEFCDHLQEMGVDAHPCHIGQFDYRDNRVWLGKRPIDIILRIFIIEDLHESPEAPALMDRVLNAAATGQVRMFTPLDAELFASKATLAMLSDERNRHLFRAEELCAMDRILPWTRMVRQGEVTLEDGSRVDLVDYAIKHREELVLKSTVSHSGDGVVPGWGQEVTPDSWREQLTDALGGSFVLQRRIKPITEFFPGDDGDLQPWLIVWGIFIGVNGFGGVLARGARLDSGTQVINGRIGACGSALHELPPVRDSG